jgi:hypothetical protein
MSITSIIWLNFWIVVGGLYFGSTRITGRRIKVHNPHAAFLYITIMQLFLIFCIYAPGE